MQEPQNVEAALIHAIKLEAFEQLLVCQGTIVNHNDGHAMHWPCSLCTVTGPLYAGETFTLHELIRDLWSTLAQVTRGMAALANELGSGHTIPSEAASSVGSTLDTVSMLPVPTHKHSLGSTRS